MFTTEEVDKCEGPEARVIKAIDDPDCSIHTITSPKTYHRKF